jgi:serine/threonine protein kinase
LFSINTTKAIGEGAVGKVYLAKHKESNELFALKRVSK